MTRSDSAEVPTYNVPCSFIFFKVVLYTVSTIPAYLQILLFKKSVEKLLSQYFFSETFTFSPPKLPYLMFLGYVLSQIDSSGLTW